MRLVLLATLVYLGILVAVLAVGLIMIAWRLMATAAALEKVYAALASVKDDTGPLSSYLEGINGALTQLGGGLSSVLSRLARADRALGRIIEKVKAA